MNGIFESVLKYKWPVIYINGGNNKIQKKKYKMEIPKTQSSLACTCEVKGSDSVAFFEHAHSGIMGNQGKMAGNSKICIGIQSQLILPEFIYIYHVLFEKCNL